jgi:hypothetical protein
VAATCEVAHVRTVAERGGTWLEGLKLGVGGGPIEPSMLLTKGNDEDPMSSVCSKEWSVFMVIIMAYTVVFTYATKRPVHALKSKPRHRSDGSFSANCHIRLTVTADPHHHLHLLQSITCSKHNQLS